MNKSSGKMARGGENGFCVPWICGDKSKMETDPTLIHGCWCCVTSGHPKGCGDSKSDCQLFCR